MKTKQLLINGIVVGGLLWSAAGTRADETGDQRLDALDQKVKILERILELAEEASLAKAKEAPGVTAGKDGFSLASADKSFALKLRGYAQGDARFYVNDEAKSAADTFLLRRARLIVDGTLGKKFEFRIAPDFGGGQTQLQDGYIDFKGAPSANIRIGRAKPPFGIERLQSSSETLFTELGLPAALGPGYDTGVQLYGSASGGVVDYAFGVFNGVPDGGGADTDAGDAKDLVGRVFVTPFKNTDLWALNGLSLGVAGSVGNQEGTTAATALPSLKTSGQQTYFSYKTSTNTAEVAFADGARTRVSPQLYYVAGPLGLLGEYVISEQEVTKGKQSEDLKNTAWGLTASYVLTGESPSLKGVQPLSPFDPTAGNWGAVELVARVGHLDVDDAAFSGGYADAKKSASAAQNWGVGVNWYLTKNVKLVADYDRTTFDGGSAKGDRLTEQFVSTRAQVSF